MDRRSFLGHAAGALISSSTFGALPVDAQDRPLEFIQPREGIGTFRRTRSGKQPHLILISADMVGPDLYHPDRPLSTHVNIPNLRSLIADGTFFANAFCTVPLCAPSRASYMTGRYSYIQGNGERAPDGLESQLRSEDIIFPEYLRAAGYISRQMGKGHVGTKKYLDAFGENDQPWDRWSPPVFDDDEFLTYQRQLGVKPQKYSREIVFKLQDRTSPGNSTGGWVVQEDGNPFPIEATYSYFLAKRAVDFVKDAVRTGQTTKHPIYVQLDLFDPHQPFSIPAGFEQRERELRAKIGLPQTYEDVRARDFKKAPDEPEILDIYRKYWGLYDPKTLLDYRVAYVLQMEVVDVAIGMLLRELKDAGIYNEAAIAFISDHGEMNGRRAVVDKGVYLYPDVLRVPFVIKTPGQKRSAIVKDSVSLLDLSQTMLDFAGIKPAARMDGTSLMPALTGHELPKRRPLLFFGGWHVGVNFACGVEHRASDGHHFLYAYNCSSPNDELYDLDAEDAVNLISNPDHKTVRDSMIRRLGDALQSDPRWVGYWAEFRVARYSLLPKTSGDMQLFTKPD
jgi:arylsulfatase A-like enzyme